MGQWSQELHFFLVCFEQGPSLSVLNVDVCSTFSRIHYSPAEARKSPAIVVAIYPLRWLRWPFFPFFLGVTLTHIFRGCFCLAGSRRVVVNNRLMFLDRLLACRTLNALGLIASYGRRRPLYCIRGLFFLL